MGKIEILCPHCGQENIMIETQKKQDGFKKVKGVQSWRPLVTKISETEWVENPDYGIGILCMCGKYSVLSNFTVDAASITVNSGLSEKQVFSVYCDECKTAFVTPHLKCSSCGKQF